MLQEGPVTNEKQPQPVVANNIPDTPVANTGAAT